VHAGEYFIEPGTTTAGLLDQFTRGDVLLYSFTIIEGWNQWDLLRALHAHPQIDAQMSEEDWPALLDELWMSWVPRPTTRKGCSFPKRIVSPAIPVIVPSSNRRTR
jgi:cell division protein YceG involved in septum cleavage